MENKLDLYQTGAQAGSRAQFGINAHLQNLKVLIEKAVEVKSFRHRGTLQNTKSSKKVFILLPIHILIHNKHKPPTIVKLRSSRNT